jgi:hypothetical protein
MRKTAIAMALAAAATTAQAQVGTTVGVDGWITTSIQQYNNGSDSYTRFNDGSWTVSRIGFFGREDIGGGNAVTFRLESQVNLSNGSQGSTTVAANETFNREAYVGFATKNFGEIRFGRQDVTVQQDHDAFVSQAGNFAQTAVNGTSTELGTDQKNAIKWIASSGQHDDPKSRVRAAPTACEVESVPVWQHDVEQHDFRQLQAHCALGICCRQCRARHPTLTREEHHQHGSKFSVVVDDEDHWLI